jgi:hypothetical protein
MFQTLPIWHDNCADELRAAGPSVMLVAVFLKYNANAIGFFPLKFEVVSRATGLHSHEIKAMLPLLEQIGFLRYHQDSQMAWIVEHATTTLGQLRANNQKMITQANTEFAAISKTCPMRDDFLWQYESMLRLNVREDGNADQPTVSIEQMKT